MEKAKKAANKLVKTSSVFGLPRIFQTERVPVKILWSLLIFISAFFGLYVIGKNIAEFLRYDVVTLTKQIEPESIIFPSITLCEGSDNPNITNKIISIKFKGKELDMQGDSELLKLNGQYHCLRFNGYRKSLKNFEINLNDSLKNSLLFSFNSPFNDSKFFMYIKDNYEDSFMSTHPVFLEVKKSNLVLFFKTVSRKLGEPYSSC